MRVAVITNIIAPYKSPLFQELSRRLKGELLVVYETAMESNRHWTPESSLAFENIVLPSFSIDLRRLVSDLYVHVPWRPRAPCDAFGGICSDFSAIGSFYFDFWLPGVILGMASLGVGSALVWRRYLVRRDPLSSFVAGTWAVFLPIVLRAAFMPALSWFLIFLVPGLLILHVAALAPSSTRARPRAGQALGRAS
jgi:hypothetical protein